MNHSVKGILPLKLMQALRNGTLSLISPRHRKCVHHLCAMVRFSHHSGANNDDNNDESSRKRVFAKTNTRVNPRLLGHKQLSQTLTGHEKGSEIDSSSTFEDKSRATSKSSRQLLLSKQRSLSPASRVASMLPDNFWRDSQTQEAVSNLAKSPGSGDSHTHLMDPEDEASAKNIIELQHSSLPVSKTVSKKSRRKLKADVTLHQFLQRIKTPVWAPSPKVIWSMLYSLGIQPGQTVLEGGSGAGVTGLLLSRSVGEEGFVFSVDHQGKCHKASRKRYDEWCQLYERREDRHWTNNISHHNCALHEVEFLPEPVDMVFVDIHNHASILESVIHRLKSGGCLALYLRSISQVTDVLECVRITSLPLILEGVWEESNYSILVHAKEYSDQLSYSLGAARSEEKDTAFLAKFRKLSTMKKSTSPPSYDNSKSEKHAHANHHVFREGDALLLNAMEQLKKRKFRRTYLTIEAGTKYVNDWGQLQHDQLLNKSPGDTVQTSAKQTLYLTNASIYDWLQDQGDEKRIRYNTRLFHQMGNVIDISSGSKVLAVGNNMTPLVIMMRQFVGPRGFVSAFDSSYEVVINVISALQQTMLVDVDYAKNVCVNPSNTHVQDTSQTYDAMCIVIDDLDQLSLHDSYQLLKSGGKMAILCFRFDILQSALDMLSKTDDLIVDEVWVDKEREWTVRRARLDSEQEMRAPYLCRPRQGLHPPTGLVIEVTKTK